MRKVNGYTEIQRLFCFVFSNSNIEEFPWDGMVEYWGMQENTARKACKTMI